MSLSRLYVPAAVTAAATVSAVLLTGCGSSGGGGGASSASRAGSSAASSTAATPAASSTAASSTASSTAAGGSSSGTPATKAQLAKIVLQRSDLPTTFKATPAQPDSDDNNTQAQLQTCTGVKGAPDSHKVNTAQSSDYNQGNLTVSSEFSSYRSAADVKADVALLQSPKINPCLNSIFKQELARELGSKATVTNAAIKLTPGSGGGPSNVAGLASGTVNFTAQGKKAVVYLGVAFITGPQLTGTLSYVGLNQGLETTAANTALAAVAKRAQNP
ncbi:hypothetical protein [uncultured Jatrophihabitans sp.]|uniref:hypothetical protein n=1 Tax=uncultured Jatrophihabitans sp. TaxID=1610747 RepID=UPI0035CB95D1